MPKTLISECCYEPFNYVTLLNFVRLFSRPEKVPKLSEDRNFGIFWKFQNPVVFLSLSSKTF